MPKHTTSVWECEYDGSGLHRVLDVASTVAEATWTWHDRLYIFVRTTENWGDLWAHVDGSALSRAHTVPLTHGLVNIEMTTASPLGSKIFAIGESVRGELVRLDPKSGMMTPFLGGVSAVDLNFSRDRQWVAYQRYPEHTLWRSRVDGTDARQLTFSGLEAFQPHWSADGKRIGFMGHKNGRFCVYIVNADGTNLYALKPDDAVDQGVPTWSEHDDTIVFGELRERKPDSAMEIRFIDVATRRESVMPDSRGKWSPRWSPDGRYILAESTDFRDLFIYCLNDRSWHTLAQGVDGLDDATWSYDSQFIYFRYRSPELLNHEAVARVSVSANTREVITPELPRRENPWFTVTPENEILLLHSARSQEIYALDLDWN